MCVCTIAGEKLIAVACDPFGTEITSHINIYSFADKKEEQSDKPILTITEPTRVKVSKIAWLPCNAGILAAYDNGKMAIIDISVPGGVKVKEWQAHERVITSMSFNADKTLVITSSADHTAKLWDAVTWEHLKTYVADTPLNGAAISPIREHVIAGGGQEAMNVTTTAANAGKFETRFFHMIFQKELGRVKGHFGPINALAFNPDGRSFASGGEDGYVRLHILDAEYDRLGEDEDKDIDDPVLGEELAKGALEKLIAEEEDAKARAAAAEAATAAASATGMGQGLRGAGGAGIRMTA